MAALPLRAIRALAPEGGGDAALDARLDSPAVPDGVVWIGSEHVLLLAVSLPAVPVHRRRMALTYAVEEAIAAPLDQVEVVAGPSLPVVHGQKGQRVLAGVVAKDHLAQMRPAPGVALVADVLAVPVPEMGPDQGQRWAVWSGGGTRVLVRLADGSGFACGRDDLGDLWRLAGQPPVVLYGAGLAEWPGLAPLPLPAADPRLMRFDLSGGGTGAGLRIPRPLWISATVLALAAALHLAVLAADVVALRQTAAARQGDLRTALMARGQPGVDIDGELAVALAAAVPKPPGGLLPLLAAVSQALADQDSPLQFRALRWDDADARLTLSVTAPDLAALQQAQAALTEAGLVLDSGAATSGEGAAEADLTLMAGAP